MMNLDHDRILDDFPELGYQLASQLEDWQHDGMLGKVGQLLILLANATDGMSSDEVRAFTDKWTRTLEFVDELLSVPEIRKLGEVLKPATSYQRLSMETGTSMDAGKQDTHDLLEVIEQLQQPEVLAGLDLVIGVVRGIGRAALSQR